MSEKMEAVATSEAPAALGAYSQAVKANGFVFVSGQLGIDPVHFGVIATVNLAIGQVTPPVGVNLFVAIGVSEKLQGLRDKTKVTIVSMSKAVWPQIVACIIALLLITYVPWFSTVLLFGK